MRIGFFTDSYFPRKDGLSYTLRTWKKRLEERGHEVHLYYPRSSYEPGRNEHPLNSVKNPFYRGHYWPLPDLTPVEALDVVHVHTPRWLIGRKGLKYAERNEVPTVYTYHTPLQDYFHAVLGERLAEMIMPLLHWLDRKWLEKFDAVTCSADAIPVDVEFERVPVGVDAEFFRPSRSEIVEELGLERPVIGYSGRMSEEKNLEDVLELAERTGYEFLLVGEGRHREALERRAPPNVTFHDFVDREELPGLLSSLDVFVTASTADTFSLTTVEANLCGTPALAPDVPPFDEVLSESSGERYSQGDIEHMQTKLGEVLGKTYSTREAATRYSVGNTLDRLEELYQRLDQ